MKAEIDYKKEQTLELQVRNFRTLQELGVPCEFRMPNGIVVKTGGQALPSNEYSQILSHNGENDENYAVTFD